MSHAPANQEERHAEVLPTLIQQLQIPQWGLLSPCQPRRLRRGALVRTLNGHPSWQAR